MSTQTQSTVTIPEGLKKKHGVLIALILSSESMNDEERQYWINILPVMTEPQIENLRQILQNEKDQLAAIDAKYDGDSKKGSAVSLEEMGKKRKEKLTAQRSSEAAAEAEEKKKEEEILRRIESGGQGENP
ncbi:MAG: hypothetical protein AAB853_05485 [Patescibacteria group bacterium]